MLFIPPGVGGPLRCPEGMDLHPDIIRSGGGLHCEADAMWNVSPTVLCVIRNPKIRGKWKVMLTHRAHPKVFIAILKFLLTFWSLTRKKLSNNQNNNLHVFIYSTQDLN